MPKLFISYRRSDSQAVARLIQDRLVEAGYDVFMDIKIPPGVDFREHIREVLNNADAVIAIVGPKWLRTKPGKRVRPTDSVDHVADEIEAAFHSKLKIVPILINQAVMPRADDLPESIERFSYINAIPLDTGRHFEYDIRELINCLPPAEAAAEPRSLAPPESGTKPRPRGGVRLNNWLGRMRWRSVYGAGAAGVTLCGALLLAYPLWWWKGEGGPPLLPPGARTDRPTTPPVGASIWLVDQEGSKLYLAAKGQEREFIFHEPTQQMKDLGARSGDLLFEGHRIDEIAEGRAWYEGRAWVYTGGCGTGERRAHYDAKGPVVMPGNVVVELSGQVPVVDPATCKQKRTSDGKLMVETKTMVLHFTGERK